MELWKGGRHGSRKCSEMMRKQWQVFIAIFIDFYGLGKMFKKKYDAEQA